MSTPPSTVNPSNLASSESVPLLIQTVQILFGNLDKNTKYPVSFKLIVDGKNTRKYQTIPRNQALNWRIDRDIYVRAESHVALFIREKRIFNKQQVAQVEFSGKDVLELYQGLLTTATEKALLLQEMVVPDKTSNVTVKITFVTTGNTASQQVSKAAKVMQQQSLLDRWSKTQATLDTIMKIGGAFAELHPIAKTVVGLVQQAYNHIKLRKEYDSILTDLIDGIFHMLPFIEPDKVQVRTEPLRGIINDMLALIMNASNFVLLYKSDGVAVQALGFLVSSTARDQVNDLTKQFSILKQKFDRGMQKEILEALISAEEFMLLKELSPVARAQYNPEYACMAGTRQKIIQQITDWASDQASAETLFWLHALAGSGKSSVAASVADLLHSQKILAASFFCKRDDPSLRDPQCVISTLVHQLSLAYVPFGKLVAEAIKEERGLPTAAIRVQFDGLLVKPMQQLAAGGFQKPSQPLVVVVDALDECGNNQSRRQLLLSLQEIPTLADWLKVFVTSRPNKDIQDSFSRSAKVQMIHCDLNVADDPSDDIIYFTEHCMSEIASSCNLSSDQWPGKSRIHQLAQHASGLFIWIKTMADFVSEGMVFENKDHRLDLVLQEGSHDDDNGNENDDPTVGLNGLYVTALEECIPKGKDNLKVFHTVVGAIIATATRTPLPVDVLAALLGQRVGTQTPYEFIAYLGSVLYKDEKNNAAVRVSHPSFIDFLTGPQCPERFYIHLEQQNTDLTLMCLEVMTTGLKFNICGLESSYYFNKDIDDLELRIGDKILPQLQYSCLYWASHLSGAARKELHGRIGQKLRSFFLQPLLLYWLEVLSLIGSLDSAARSLAQMQGWVQDPHHELSQWAYDTNRFMLAFYEPISCSTPHLYISALSFAPQDTWISKTFTSFFPNRVHIEPQHDYGKNWPASLITMTTQKKLVICVAFSPTGQYVVSGTVDGNIQIWNAMTGQAVSEPLVGHTGRANSVAFSPDGQHVVSGSGDATIRIWDAQTGVAVSEPLIGHTDRVYSVAYSPDGQRIVSGSRDTTIRIWDTQTRVAVGEPLEGHTGPVNSVAYSKDGQYIVSGSDDLTIQIWDAHTGIAVCKPLQGHTGVVRSVAYSPDGQHIISGSEDKTIHIWNAQTGAVVGEPLTGHTEWVNSVAYSPDGQHIVSGSGDATVCIWDIKTRSSVGEPLAGHTDWVRSVAYSPDGQHIVSGSNDATIQIWDAQTGVALGKPSGGHTAKVNSVAYSLDGLHIVSGSSDATIRIWDAQTGVAVGEPLAGQTEWVRSVAYSPVSHKIVSGSDDATICIWDAQTGKPISGPLVGHTGAVNSVAFSPDGQHIVSGSDDKTIHIWNTQTGAAVGEPLTGHTAKVNSVTYSPDGQHIVSGSSDATICIWDAQTRASVGVPLQGHTARVNSVGYSPDSQYIVSGSGDATICIWNARTQAARPEPLTGHTSGINSVAYSPDGHHIVSGSGDTTIRIWDAQTGIAVGEPLAGHADWVRSVAYSPDGQFIVSGSGDATIRIWDAHTGGIAGEPLTSHDCGQDQFEGVRKLNQQVPQDGWIRTTDDELLLWIPFHVRQMHELCRIAILAITHQGPVHFLTFDFTHFVHGVSWTQVQTVR